MDSDRWEEVPQISPGDSNGQDLRTAGGLPGIVTLNLHSSTVR